MGLLDFPEEISFPQTVEVKRASYVFKNKDRFVCVAKNKARLKELSHKALLKISKSKNGYYVIEPNSRFGKINQLKYADITGIWKAVRYWKDFGVKVGVTKGVKLENGDIFRLGKKLFKVVRIELESLESKKKFLKKAKRKSEFGKDRLLTNKLAYSETTRIKERTLPLEKETRPREKQKDFTIQTDSAQKEMLEHSGSTQNNTTNVNNTEGMIQPERTDEHLLMFSKKRIHETEVIRKKDSFGDIKQKLVKTELDETREEAVKKIKNVINFNIEDKQSYSISGSEIDLEGVYHAEQNEFIKVMVEL